jgi:hypothetical protein
MLAKFVGDGMAGIAVGREVIFLQAAHYTLHGSMIIPNGKERPAGK